MFFITFLFLKVGQFSFILSSHFDQTSMLYSNFSIFFTPVAPISSHSVGTKRLWNLSFATRCGNPQYIVQLVFQVLTPQTRDIHLFREKFAKRLSYFVKITATTSPLSKRFFPNIRYLSFTNWELLPIGFAGVSVFQSPLSLFTSQLLALEASVHINCAYFRILNLLSLIHATYKLSRKLEYILISLLCLSYYFE